MDRVAVFGTVGGGSTPPRGTFYMSKDIPASVEWMLLEGVSLQDALWVDSKVDPTKAAEVRRQRGLRVKKARRKSIRNK